MQAVSTAKEVGEGLRAIANCRMSKVSKAIILDAARLLDPTPLEMAQQPMTRDPYVRHYELLEANSKLVLENRELKSKMQTMFEQPTAFKLGHIKAVLELALHKSTGWFRMNSEDLSHEINRESVNIWQVIREIYTPGKSRT
jgi:hypothetical protein